MVLRICPTAFSSSFRTLAQNNREPWFEENRELYRGSVQKPVVSLMRISCDVRFSADKSPFKTNVAMWCTPRWSVG